MAEQMMEREIWPCHIAEKPVLRGNRMYKKGTSGESYNLMAKLAVLRYNAIIPTG